MPFSFEKLNLDNAVLIKPQVFFDNRGYFLETYKKSEFETIGILDEFNQDNHSFSSKGVLRGLHIQRRPFGQAKLVRCVYGEIFDCIVDVRAGSKTYGQYLSFILNDKNHYILYVPEGFLHGFVTLSDEAIVLYKASKEYCKECEDGVVWNDPILNINWPIKEPIVSQKDLQLSAFKDFEAYI